MTSQTQESQTQEFRTESTLQTCETPRGAVPDGSARPAGCRIRPLWLLLALAFLLPLASRPGAADVVHLRTGETVKGRPLADRSDENVLVIEDFLSGAVRTLSWDVVDKADRDRLHREWGWENKALAAIVGHRLTLELQDGSKDDLRGLIEHEDAEFYHLRRGGKVIKVRKDRVIERVEEDMDPRDIWSPEQLVARFLEEMKKKEGVDMDALTSREHFSIATYAEEAGDYETAKKHYAICAADPTFLRAKISGQRLAEVEEILRNAAAMKGLRKIRMALSLKAFRRVREMITVFPEAYPDSGKQVVVRLEKLKKDFATRRADYFQLEAKINFPKIVLRQIKKKVQEDEIGLSDVTAWTRRELPDLAFELLTARFLKKDDVTPEDTRGFWENRRKSGWKTANYGAGTFIVEPPKIKPPKRKKPRKKKGSGGKAGPAMKIPKPPTRDQWWERAKVKDRVTWVMAFFVENSGLFELGKSKYTHCMQCQGAGLESQHLQTGATVAYLCTRCGGAQRDKRVRFR